MNDDDNDENNIIIIYYIAIETAVFSIHVLTSFLHGYSATLAAKLLIKLESWERVERVWLDKQISVLLEIYRSSQ